MLDGCGLGPGAGSHALLAGAGCLTSTCCIPLRLPQSRPCTVHLASHHPSICIHDAHSFPPGIEAHGRHLHGIPDKWGMLRHPTLTCPNPSSNPIPAPSSICLKNAFACRHTQFREWILQLIHPCREYAYRVDPTPALHAGLRGIHEGGYMICTLLLLFMLG